jgi:hypothetical protein
MKHKIPPLAGSVLCDLFNYTSGQLERDFGAAMADGQRRVRFSHPIYMRLVLLSTLAAAILFSTGCTSGESAEQRHRDANSVAGKVGQVAHKAAVQTDKAGRVIGRKLEKAAHDAHEGWKEDSQRERKRP